MTDKPMRFFANGKLLLSGEYLVMKGASALAVPLRLGQSLEIKGIRGDVLHWRALEQGNPWFEAHIDIPSLNIRQSSCEKTAAMLVRILRKACTLNADFTEALRGQEVTTRLGFNRLYGFGSSSTLVYNLASWAGVDPYALYAATFGGSGYDIAAAGSGSPFIYRLHGSTPVVEQVRFRPPFLGCIYFAYSGLKKSTAESIRLFDQETGTGSLPVEEISDITQQMAKAPTLEAFNLLMRRHEDILSGILQQAAVRVSRFADLDGEVKSLGAWGGDFYMITWKHGPAALAEYLNGKKIDTFYSYDALVLS
jgi:mevalonate kinase